MTAPVARQSWGALGAAVGAVSTGELLHTVETQSAVLRHAYYRPGATVIQRELEDRAIVYTVGGPIFRGGTEERALGRRLIYLPRGHDEVLRFDGPAHVLAIEILPSWTPPGAEAGWPDEPLPLIATLYEQVWEVLIAIAERRPSAAVRTGLDRLLSDVLTFSRKRAPEWLRHLVDDLHENWQTSPMLADLSRQYGKSVQHICRSLKSYTGTTLQRYLLLLRLDHARGLIWGTDMPLSAVANATGFADQSHLTRALSSHLEITPLRLRRAAPCLQRERFLVTEESG
ncbi:MAG TPA: AraC family transcriptional regulator [Allosphingosinicella sp.]|jgi:AraC-like DNA-binding protein